MKLGIVTDTHENRDMVIRAVEVFNEQEVDMVVHAGDMVAPFTAAHFAKLKMPFKFHKGNNDGEILFLKQTIENFGGEYHIYDFSFELDKRRFLVQHEPQNLEAIADSGRFDCVIYGHTHDVDIREDGTTLIVNPGECCTWLRGLANVGILDTKTMQVELFNLLS